MVRRVVPVVTENTHHLCRRFPDQFRQLPDRDRFLPVEVQIFFQFQTVRGFVPFRIPVPPVVETADDPVDLKRKPFGGIRLPVPHDFQSFEKFFLQRTVVIIDHALQVVCLA